MQEFAKKYAENIEGILNCFDRIILKGYLPISWPEAMESFLRREKVLVKDFKRYVIKTSARVIEHAQAMAKAQQRPFYHIRGLLDKETAARWPNTFFKLARSY
jgi:hypothetical protein